MKTILKRKFVFVFLCIAYLLTSCELINKADNEDSTPLLAKAGADYTAAVNTTVTLDGSASTGPENMQYEWILNNQNGESIIESDINFQNKNTAIATFEPKKNGIYNFILRITLNGKFSEDQIQITVAGSITLGGTLTSNLVLKSIGGQPDYIISSDLVVPNGISITAEGNMPIFIEIAENAGIEIQQGGSVSILNSATRTYFKGTNGWKGFLVNGGNLSLTYQEIDNAGKTAFAGQSEAAVVTVTNNGNVQLTQNAFTGSLSYDVLLSETANTNSSITNNSLTFSKPIKAPISFLKSIPSNVLGDTYEYIVLTTPGAGTALTGSFEFGRYKYYIDGDFTVGSNDLVSANYSTIYMKEGAGILASNININNSTIQGINGTSWKGIAVASTSIGSSRIGSSELINAGSAVFSTGSFTSTAKAAVYYTGDQTLTIVNSKFTNSKGYGIYDDSPFGYFIFDSNANTFTNPALSAIRLTPSDIANTFSSSIYSILGGIVAVEVSGTGYLSRLPALGANNYYLFSDNLVVNTDLVIKPGAILKFKSGKYIYVNNSKLTAIGDASNYIVFDGLAGAAGSWPGIFIDSNSKFNFEYCKILNGGESLMNTASEKANIIIKTNGGAQPTLNTFANNFISGSGGYGVVLEIGSYDFSTIINDVSNAYSSNTSANTLKK